MANNVLIKKMEPVPFPSGERWDRDLTKSECKRLASHEKKKRTFTALTRKIAILQHASGSLAALNSEPIIPPDRKRLRDWYDPNRGLWTWIDVKLDNPDNASNKDEITAFFAALIDIRALTELKPSALKNKIVFLNNVIKRLEIRNAELLELNNLYRTKYYNAFGKKLL